MYSYLSTDELVFATKVMNIFSCEVEQKFKDYKREVDFYDVRQYEVGERLENGEYIMIGCRYRQDTGEVIFTGRAFSEVGEILKRKRIAVDEKTFCVFGEDHEILYNKDCDSVIRTVIGAYIELIYTGLFLKDS